MEVTEFLERFSSAPADSTAAASGLSGWVTGWVVRSKDDDAADVPRLPVDVETTNAASSLPQTLPPPPPSTFYVQGSIASINACGKAMFVELVSNAAAAVAVAASSLRLLVGQRQCGDDHYHELLASLSRGDDVVCTGTLRYSKVSQSAIVYTRT